MASNMDYESPYKSDSPFSYEVEDGELSCESGRSSPGTIRDCASKCGTQTESNMITDSEKVTTFRVELENNQEHVQTPQEIARKINNKFGNRRNLQSFDTSNNSTSNISEQRTNIAVHSYQNTRPRQNYNQNTSNTYMSPPLPNYPRQYDHPHHQTITHHKVTLDNVYLQDKQFQILTIYDFHMR